MSQTGKGALHEPSRLPAWGEGRARRAVQPSRRPAGGDADRRRRGRHLRQRPALLQGRRHRLGESRRRLHAGPRVRRLPLRGHPGPGASSRRAGRRRSERPLRPMRMVPRGLRQSLPERGIHRRAAVRRGDGVADLGPDKADRSAARDHDAARGGHARTARRRHPRRRSRQAPSDGAGRAPRRGPDRPSDPASAEGRPGPGRST